MVGVSFDTFNLFHRWIGRLVAFEALAHTFLWGANNYEARGLEGLAHHLRGDLFLVYGLVSMVAMCTILVQSVSIVRHAFYETFLHLHQVLAATAVVGILLHCEIQVLPQRPLLYTFISIWGIERLFRLCRIFHRRGTTVQVEALEGGACRLTFKIQGTWRKSPGCHIYAYIPAVSLWMSHPFSVVWVLHPPRKHAWLHRFDSGQTLMSSFSKDTEAGLKCLPADTRTEISCIVASRSGMTAALYRKASRSSTGAISLRAFVEGPYGGLENMRSYGTVLLFAGGVGITHQLSHLHDLVTAWSEGTCSTRKAVLVWSVRSAEQLEWTRPFLDEILRIPRHGNLLKILAFVTRGMRRDSNGADTAKEMGVNDFHVSFGRMNAQDLVLQEFRERAGAMCVSVCGPGGLADDVRAAARAMMDLGNVDFWEESFTW